MPKVSIIMPAYNAGRFIAETIRSVLDQTHNDWELLVVNDGSTDDTEKVVAGFTDHRIRYFQQANAGVSVARNRGLKEMSGDFFCFLDADDLFLPHSLSSRLEVFAADAGIAFVDGCVEVRSEKLDKLLRFYQPTFTGNPIRSLVRLGHGCFLGNTWMVRRRPSYNYAFRAGITHGEDRIFYMDIADHGSYAFTSEVILIYRRREGSAMSNLDGLQRGYEHLYRVVNNKRKRVKLSDRLYLKYKITRIMFLSNLRAGRYHKAFASVLRNAALH